MEKEYNVILRKGADYDQFWSDMETITNKDGVPNRQVEVANRRNGSYRQTHYFLTDAEKAEIETHPSVLTVEIPPEQRDDVEIGLTGVQEGIFTKSPGTTEAHVNYALTRLKSKSNNFGTATTINEDYIYNLDASGVDVVIQDSGIEVNHPEWQDENGITRLRQINWATESGLGFTQNANHYRDLDGHGTHCAGIAAGKTFGWAKNARIYSQKLAGLEGSGDSGTGISVSFAFDAIKLWHRNKPIDPKTGKKRPTVVNMSWGYFTSYSSVSQIVYRGSTINSGISDAQTRENNYGLVNFYSVSAGAYITNVRITSVDTDVEEMIDEGIHVTIAAGNRRHKIALEGQTDYDNRAVTPQGTKYYMRGSSPHSQKAYMVGNLDNTAFDATQDQSAESSEKGPGVNIWAPGTQIMSATSNTNSYAASAYHKDPSFKQVAISGTSMAAPQVAGIVALYCQANPGISPENLKKALLQNSGDALYDTVSTDDYSNHRSLLESEKRIAFNKFGNKENCFQVEGNFEIPLTISF